MGALTMRWTLALALAIAAASPAAAEPRWKPIFNGKNLDGWTVKVNHHPAGENWRNTVRVKDGVLAMSYADYPDFKDQFTHLVYNRPLHAYRLRLEYRFTGPRAPGAPAWADRNSGVMLHGQPAGDMGLDQPFPISVEAQLLGGDGTAPRTTANVCTPGTTVSIGGVPQKPHCLTSTSKTFTDGEWVRFEVEVHGARLVRQIVNGEVVMEYTDVRLDPSEFKEFANVEPSDPRAQALAARAAQPLDRGYISLQGEGSPVEFRKIEVMELPD
jgi:hypothetical protein